jgi:peptidyl-prolyl cis-trans isomerase-like 4
MSVLIETSLGDLTIDLNTSTTPKAAINFLKLTKMKYYHFGRFHKVQKDFIVTFNHPFKISTSLNR